MSVYPRNLSAFLKMWQDQMLAVKEQNAVEESSVEWPWDSVSPDEFVDSEHNPLRPLHAQLIHVTARLREAAKLRLSLLRKRDSAVTEQSQSRDSYISFLQPEYSFNCSTF